MQLGIELEKWHTGIPPIPTVLSNAQNPLHTFPRRGEVANLLWTCCGLLSKTANKLL